MSKSWWVRIQSVMTSPRSSRSFALVAENTFTPVTSMMFRLSSGLVWIRATALLTSRRLQPVHHPADRGTLAQAEIPVNRYNYHMTETWQVLPCGAKSWLSAPFEVVSAAHACPSYGGRAGVRSRVFGTGGAVRSPANRRHRDSRQRSVARGRPRRRAAARHGPA